MSRRRTRRSEKTHRHASAPSPTASNRPAIIREATQVERLAYTRTQAAEALGISRSTFIRRVLPYIETIETGWGARLVPVDEVERFVAQRRRNARAEPMPRGRPGRKSGLSADVLTRVRDESANGMSFGEIARGLNADRVPTAQGGRQWWSSTVRAVLIRSSQAKSSEG
jgi:hypothetical protein